MKKTFRFGLVRNLCWLVLSSFAVSLYGQKDLKTKHTQIGIDECGYYQSIQVNGQEVLGKD